MGCEVNILRFKELLKLKRKHKKYYELINTLLIDLKSVFDNVDNRLLLETKLEEFGIDEELINSI